MLNVFVDTPTESRIRQVIGAQGLRRAGREQNLDDLDQIRSRRIRELFKINWRDPTRYDILLNTARTSVETAAQTIALVSQRAEYRPTLESLQAMRDLATTAGVEAVLLATDLRIANLEVESHCGEVHISGIIVAEGIKKTVVATIRKIPRRNPNPNPLRGNSAGPVLYGDAR